MPLEIERKWLIDPDWKPPALWPVACRDSYIIQMGLQHPDEELGATERIRQRTHMVMNQPCRVELTHTVKRPGAVVGIREEFEQVIDRLTFEALIERRDLGMVDIEKARRVFDWKGQTFELDFFETPPGIMVLECEVDDLDGELELPPWIPVLLEVTNDPNWTNTTLSKFERMARIRVRYIANATGTSSDPTAADKHSEFAKLIDMDKDRLTRLLVALVDENIEEDGWVPLRALSALWPGDTGAYIPEVAYGQFVNISQAWLLWGEAQGYRTTRGG